MKQNMVVGVLAAALLIALRVPAFAEDANAIADAENAKWLQAHNKGDAATLTALYTKDAVLISPGTAIPVVGSANIRKYYEADLAHPIQNLVLKQTETRSLGPDTVLDAGTWSADVQNEKGGAARHLTGPYVVTFVRQGSGWLLQTDASSLAASQQ